MKRIAILSASGSGRKRTIPALEKSNIAKVIAIHGRDSEKIRDLSKQYEIEYFTDIEQLKLVDFDIIYIASPPFLHREQLNEFVNDKRHIICEKPLCISKEDGEFILKNFGERDDFMVAHHLRHQKAILRIKEIIDKKELGEIRSASFQWNFKLNKSVPSAEWKLNPKLGGNNPFYDAGIHVIDMALLFFGKPESLYASAFLGEEPGMYETASSVLRYENFNVFLGASSVQSLMGNDLIIYFENGYVRAQQAFTEKCIKQIEIYTETECLIEKFDDLNLYLSEVEEFCKYLDGKDSEYVGTTLKEGLLGLDILSTISESISTNKIVSINHDKK